MLIRGGYVNGVPLKRIYSLGQLVFDAETPLPPPPEELASTVVVLRADNESNTTHVVSDSFSPSDVDVGNNTINMTTALNWEKRPRQGTPVRFTSTGTLPAPLQEDTEYMVERIAEGLRIYPVARPEDWPILPGYAEGETVFPGQHYYFGLNAVVLEDGGNGTHTMISHPLLSVLADVKGVKDAGTPSGIANQMIELVTDEHGTFMMSRGVMANLDEAQAWGNLYGKSMAGIGGNTMDLANAMVNKRYCYAVVVARPKPYNRNILNRAVITPPNLNIDTGVFTFQTHGFSNGDHVEAGIYPDSILPPELESLDLYARSINNTTFSLHPTSEDAVNNTNVITYTDAGTGKYWIRATNKTGPNVAVTQLFLTVNHPNGAQHMIAPQMAVGMTRRVLQSNVISTGSNNGNWNSLYSLSQLNQTPVGKVVIWGAPGTIWPTRLDTGMPLEPGEYWTTLTGSNTGRLHDTYASALESVGVSTQLSSCIKYSASGNGEVAVQFADEKFIFQGNDNGLTPAVPQRQPNDVLAAYAFTVDFTPDNGEFSRRKIMGINGYDNAGWYDFTGYESSWGLKTTATGSNYVLFNAAEPHVCGREDVYAVVIGSSDTEPREDIEKIVAWAKDKYGIS